MKISVVVPVYNVKNDLEKCVDSIRRQTFSDIEIILVDDGSTDESGAMCDRFALEDDRIRVIHKENGGLSSARNAGIDVAQGEYSPLWTATTGLTPACFKPCCAPASRPAHP